MGFSAWEKGDANIGLVWLKKKCSPWEFPGSPVVSDFAAEGMGSILQAVCTAKNREKKRNRVVLILNWASHWLSGKESAC